MDYSIIIPHRDVPDLLERCLASIPQMPGLEIIVVDDNSQPGKLPSSDRADVRIILTKKGGGAGYARNVALPLATGKWLLFVDADDFVTDDFAALITSHKDDDADMVVFQADSISEQTGNPSTRHIQHNQAVESGLTGKESARQSAIGVAAPWCRMIRRELVERYELRFDELMVANDVMFVSRAVCLARKIAFDPGVLYVITDRQGSLVHSHTGNADRYLTRMDVCARANNLYRQNGLRRLPILRMVWQSRRQRLFLRSLTYALKRGILFSGMSNYAYLIRRKLCS